MTLLEILRQELPKRGGCPEGVNFIAQENGGSVWGFVNEPEKDEDDEWMEILRTGTHKLLGHLPEASDHATAIVTREQYEATGWDGTGLPPVGCECEYQYKVHGSEWCSFECVAVDGNVAFGWSNSTPTALQLNTHNFRPLRTEADKKRDAAVVELSSVIDYRNGCSSKPLAGWLYDAIAAGKIPGVKLEV